LSGIETPERTLFAGVLVPQNSWPGLAPLLLLSFLFFEVRFLSGLNWFEINVQNFFEKMSKRSAGNRNVSQWVTPVVETLHANGNDLKST